MTNTCLARPRNDRGAVLVHVTVAIVGLLAFAALVIDYGIMWSGRRQAQNAADAAALAGAVSMAYDAPGDYDRSRADAKAIGDSNLSYGASPNITLGSGDSDDTTEDISFPLCPPGSPGVPDTCVRVNAYRNEDTNPLPTFFARLFGRSEHSAAQTGAILERATRFRGPGNLVLVSHGSTIVPVSGVSPAPAEMIVMKPAGAGSLKLVGRIPVAPG